MTLSILSPCSLRAQINLQYRTEFLILKSLRVDDAERDFDDLRSFYVNNKENY